MAFSPKYLSVHAPITVADRIVKRYYVTNDDAPMDAAVEQAALAQLPQLLPDPDDETPAAAFLVLHRGGDGSAYLNTYSWVWGNVISCTNAAAGQPMVDCPDDDPTHFVTLSKPWIGCVWELPAIGHERSAWIRHILTPDRPDLDAYLEDTMAAGLTGGP